jgi:transposase
MLKRQKGYSIATKSLKAKLIRQGFDLQETKDAYNNIVHFYFLLIDEDRSGLEIPISDNGGWRYYELKTQNDPFIVGFPSSLKRAAIRQAIGAWESWNSNYQKWLNRPKKHLHHSPPVQPKTFNFNPQYDSGMWKEDDGHSIVIKILVEGSWRWVKHFYECRDIDSAWIKGSPRVQVNSKGLWLVFPLEKYIPATGGVRGIMSKPKFRTCGVDMDLDKHIAICTILETDDRGETIEVARHFINQSRHVARRKRNLGKIAIAMGQTGIVSKGVAKTRWDKLSANEEEFGRAAARQVTEFAKYWEADLISFEHLGNLRPQKGKYSKRSNQKRAYWLKSKVYNQVKRIAFQDYGILTTRVSPRNTSRLSPWGESVWRGTDFNKVDGSYQPGSPLVAAREGYKAHSGINAARNIALKAIKRNLPEATLTLKA